MAQESAPQRASSNLGQTSRISHDKVQAEVSSSHPSRQDILDAANDLFPHGHRDFNELMLQQMELHSEKNRGYAEGGSPLGNFDRAAQIMNLYPNFPVWSAQGMLLMYVLKHFDRIMWDMSIGRPFPSDDACADISVYMNILRCMRRG